MSFGCSSSANSLHASAEYGKLINGLVLVWKFARKNEKDVSERK